MPKLVSTLALASATAVGLYIPTFGLFDPLGACERMAATASAAPSPTCASDLRECLRQSADMHPASFDRIPYVTADDVARCVEAFNACIHGTLNGNPSPPKFTPTAEENSKGFLPQHFGIDSEHFSYDCSADEGAVTCTSTWKTASAEMDSFTQTITGTMSGLTMTGTAESNMRYHNSAGCRLEANESHPVKFAFSTDGTVAVHSEPYDETVKYTCPDSAGSNTISAPALDFTANWSQK